MSTCGSKGGFKSRSPNGRRSIHRHPSESAGRLAFWWQCCLINWKTTFWWRLNCQLQFTIRHVDASPWFLAWGCPITSVQWKGWNPLSYFLLIDIIIFWKNILHSFHDILPINMTSRFAGTAALWHSNKSRWEVQVPCGEYRTLAQGRSWIAAVHHCFEYLHQTGLKSKQRKCL